MHIDAKLWLWEHFEREKSKAAPPEFCERYYVDFTVEGSSPKNDAQNRLFKVV